MAQNHKQQGAAMPWTNGTGSAVAAGQVVPLPDMIGVSFGVIADGAEGELATEEVWELPKDNALAIDQGDQVYWDVANSEIDKTDTNVPAGKCFKSAALADTTILVKINA